MGQIRVAGLKIFTDSGDWAEKVAQAALGASASVEKRQGLAILLRSAYAAGRVDKAQEMALAERARGATLEP